MNIKIDLCLSRALRAYKNPLSFRQGLILLCLVAAAVAFPVPPVDSKDGADSRVAKGEAAAGSYSKFRLNPASQAELLRQAPREFTRAARERKVILNLPMPDGTFARFRVEESPVMEPSLAARFPQIKTYKGKGVDDPTATARIDSTPAGFHAIVLSARGNVVIAPAAQGDPNTYLSYDTSSPQAEGDSFMCSTTGAGQIPLDTYDKGLRLTGNMGSEDSIGGTLRTYRLAVAATAEYTQTYGGGSVAGALAAITTVINQVNAIYERDLGLRLILINNETDIIFTNSSTDGYASDDVNTMQSQNQALLDARIGANSYDIGHVFDGHSSVGNGRFFFQGRGDVASVCASGRKGKGASIFRLLEPSAINAVYVVAHEMGHQFGASHTFNGTTTSDCLNGRVASTAFEPGTGSTIMAYRGSSGTNFGYVNLCGAEDLKSTDLYFHIASVSQIVNYTSGGGGAVCGSIVDTGNNPPTIDAGPDYTIPRGTPFTLTASASDPDGDSLTYCWEELDLGAPSPPSTDDGSRPIFRSFAPASSPSRTFPQLSDILNGTATPGESLPVTTRTMTFQATVRDNHAGGGGGSTDAMLVKVTSGSGPFAVTEPSAATATSWPASSTQTIRWDVANTSNAPIGCTSVRILLSTDGGQSFPLVLAQNTPNNGVAVVTVPNAPTTAARVKVEAVGNIFFDISDSNFSITAGAASAIQLAQASYSFNEGTVNTPQGFGLLSVDVTRGDTTSAATVQFYTSDQSGGNECNRVTGHASGRCDYTQVAGTLRFAAGEGTKTIQIPIVNDGYQEGAEVFTLKLQNAVGADMGSISQATITIEDDAADSTPTSGANNPYLSNSFFVRLNYLDFLSREPDASGFIDWTTALNSCGPEKGFLGAPKNCDRAHVSHGFFASPESTDRGFLIYRIYEVGMNRLPRYSEFTPDMASLSGFGLTDAVKEQNLADYLQQFTSKQEFQARFAGALQTTEAAALIQKLEQTAGVTLPATATTNPNQPTQYGRQELINLRAAGTFTVGQTLKAFVEQQAVYDRCFPRGQVTLLYFAYLKRDPDLNDPNLVGWTDWVDVFTNGRQSAGVPPRDIQHLIFGFIYSEEYRKRFGQP